MISHFKNRYLGQTCIIIGNGPSLVNVPRPFLNMYPTFGQNKCYLNEPPLVDFHPTFYVTSDPDNDIDYVSVSRLHSDKFIRKGLMQPGVKVHEFELTRNHVFSKSPHVCLYEGYSVTYISLQLAYYFGFHTVLLVGVDHHYIKYNPEIEDDPNHFTPKYKGMTNFDPVSLAKGDKFIHESMIMARVVYEMDGRKIYNLNPESRLKVFKFSSVEDWM